MQPNPTNGNINVLLNKLSNDNAMISLVNMQGQILDTQKTSAGTAGLSFDATNYPNGVYIINIITDKGDKKSFKVIKSD